MPSFRPAARAAAVLIPAAVVPVLGAVPPLLVCLWLLGADLRPLLSPVRDLLSLVTSRYFDAQAFAMLAGRLDVPCGVLKGEAFFIGDACFGYYGLTPSLLRIPLNALCPSCVFLWAKPMVVAALLTSYAALLLIARRALDGAVLSGPARTAWATAFATAAALGGTLVFMAGNPITYHESILWGGAFALVAYWALAEYAAAGRPWALAVALGATLLAVNGRVSVGLGVVVAGGLLLGPGLLGRQAWLERLFPGGVFAHGWMTAAVGLALLGAAAATPVAVHLLKFGQASPPMERQGFYLGDPLRMELVKQGVFQVNNLPCTVAAYFSPGSVRVGPAFPWLYPATGIWMPPDPLPRQLEDACRGTNMDNIEPFYAVPYTHPALLLLALAGLAGLRGERARRWWPLLAGGIAGSSVLLYSTITQRYVHDLFPLLAVGAALGLPVLAGIRRAWLRRAACGGLLAATLLGLHVNVAAALLHPFPQPEVVWRLRTLQRELPRLPAALRMAAP